MTTIEAVNVLRTIPAGVGTARERAIDYAIEQLLATPRTTTARKTTARKTAKPPVNRHVAHFLKMKFPTGTTSVPWPEMNSLVEADKRLSDGARLQLSYGQRNGRFGSDKSRDAAILHATTI